jgi:hypothetical protein
VNDVIFFAGIKKAAANAAAKVRRWIKELQINVSEHLGDGAKNASIHQKSVADDSVADFCFVAVCRESPLRISA